MINLLTSDNRHELKYLGKEVARRMDELTADKSMMVDFNAIVPTDELTPIDGFHVFNNYVKQAIHSPFKFGIQVKVVKR